MHFNIYLDDTTGQQLAVAAQQSGLTRNALIRQAVTVWLAQHTQPRWPDVVMAYQGDASAEPFEAHRQTLTPPALDPLV